MKTPDRMLLSGNEATALAALHSGVALGTGYPGTPSTEILEAFSILGGRAQWAPNEKVALEVALGVSFAGARALATMKHVGLNVAADPFFTAAYTGARGGLVAVSADDPGMASSQNEQDNRRFAQAAGVPLLEPASSQESYDFLRLGLELSERWQLPVLFRTTTRVCHSKTVVRPGTPAAAAPAARFERDVQGLVMIPAYARPAHRRLREKLRQLAEWNDESGPNVRIEGGKSLGVIASGIAFMHAREAAPEASFLKLGMTYPLPVKTIRRFVDSVERCVVVEEGDPALAEALRAEGFAVEGKAEEFRFGELTVDRARLILARAAEPPAAPVKSTPPKLCVGCPYRPIFETLRDMGCIVAGDIGCYTLGVLPPFQAMDTCVCMGASIGVGLGLRHALPDDEAKKVVSVIGDSTFIHSGLTGLAEMVYNTPKTGHVVLILDNSTTAMTGHQEHPGTGRSLDHKPAGHVSIEAVARAMGIRRTFVIDPIKAFDEFKRALTESLGCAEPSVIVARRPCLLIAGKLRDYAKEQAAACSCESAEPVA